MGMGMGRLGRPGRPHVGAAAFAASRLVLVLVAVSSTPPPLPRKEERGKRKEERWPNVGSRGSDWEVGAG